MPLTAYIVFIASGYLSGSLLFSSWIPRFFFHIDSAAASEDKNPGAFNAFRYGGLRAGVPSLLCDLLKGCLPIHLALDYLSTGDLLFSLVLAAPVLGHAFPFYRHFQGGKGIAVSFGVLLGLLPFSRPLMILAVIYIFFSVAIVVDTHLWRTVATFTFFAGFSLFLVPVPGIRLGCLIIAGIVIAKHISQIRGERFSVHLLRRSQSAGRLPRENS